MQVDMVQEVQVADIRLGHPSYYILQHDDFVKALEKLHKDY